MYGDGIFHNLPTILPRYNNLSINERRIVTRLANVHQNIEHIFSSHQNIFKLLRYPERFQLLHQGNEAVQLIFNSCLILNCHTCFNESTCNFLLRAPDIEKSLPIDEALSPPTTVSDDLLEEVYRYSRG